MVPSRPHRQVTGLGPIHGLLGSDSGQSRGATRPCRVRSRARQRKRTPEAAALCPERSRNRGGRAVWDLGQKLSSAAPGHHVSRPQASPTWL